MEFHITENGSQVDVRLVGKFTIDDAGEFRGIFDWENDAQNRSIILDLSKLDSIDSAGLGMLLYANSKSEDNNWKLSLTNPVGQVEKMLRLSRIDEVIDISE